MPLYRVNFDRNNPVSAEEVISEAYRTLKEFEIKEGQTNIKWYIVQADDPHSAMEMAGKLVYQIWGHMLTGI